jgi:protein SCO1/2
VGRLKLRTVSRLAVLTLVAVLGVGLYVARADGATPGPALHGTDLAVSGRYLPAPDFSLAGQGGTPVALAFLAAQCPGGCPPTARKLGAALRQLGAAGDGAVVVAVSTDPAGDTTAAVRAFLRAQLGGDPGLMAHWCYLTGTPAQLAPVWAAYHIAVSPGGAAQAQGVYLLDEQGRERAYLDGSFDPAAVAADLRLLGGT